MDAVRSVVFGASVIAAVMITAVIAAVMVTAVIAAVLVTAMIAAVVIPCIVVRGLVIDRGVIHVRIADMTVAVEVDMLLAVRVPGRDSPRPEFPVGDLCGFLIGFVI